MKQQGQAEESEGREEKEPSLQQQFTCVRLHQRVQDLAHNTFHEIIQLAIIDHFVNNFFCYHLPFQSELAELNSALEHTIRLLLGINMNNYFTISS